MSETAIGTWYQLQKKYKAGWHNQGGIISSSSKAFSLFDLTQSYNPKYEVRLIQFSSAIVAEHKPEQIEQK